ncbi:MAG: diaminopimelate epimerase [Pseudomonadota bacterium]
MKAIFTKAQALGNDFVIISLQQKGVDGLTTSNLADIARFVANRRLGIGCDQVIFVDTPRDHTCAMFIRFFNEDGSEAESCGNGSRAIGLWWMQRNGVGTITFQSIGGFVTTNLIDADVGLIEMILPIPVVDEMIDLGAYQIYSKPSPVVVVAGNPHVVLFVENDTCAEPWGAAIEKLPVFPAGINVNFVTHVHESTIHLTVWERGVGLTPACGTGAVGSAVASVVRGLVNGDKPITVVQAGGSLSIEIKDDCLIQRGRASIMFEGVIELGELE